MVDYLPVSAYPETYKYLRVDADKPQTRLRKLDQIALEHFDGYIAMAIHWVFLMNDDQELRASIKSKLTDEEESLMRKMNDQLAEHKCGKNSFEQILKLIKALETTGMTEDVIRATEKNPFVKLVWISIGLAVGILALMVAAAAVLAKVAPGKTTAAIVAPIVYIGTILPLYNVVKRVQQLLAFNTAKKVIPWLDEYCIKMAEPEDPPFIPPLQRKLSAIEEIAQKKKNDFLLSILAVLILVVFVSGIVLPITRNLAWAVPFLCATVLLIITGIVTITKGDAIAAHIARRIEKKQTRTIQK